jgi:hypothetical protein
MGPPPLRDAEHLLGLPNLRAMDQLKIDLANKLYKCAVRLLEVCMVLGCLVAIENPARSWLWALLALLVRETGNMEFIEWFSALESVYFDACAHGSSRDKRTKLLATNGLFTSLEAVCPQNHTHASWQPYKTEQGIAFPTAAEAEYPALLCKRMATCVSDMATTLGVVPQVSSRLKDLLKLNLGQQTVRHPPLIPEYKEYVHSETTISDPAYKLLAAPPVTGEQTTEQHDNKESPCKRARTTFKYGVWHSPEEFLQKATQVLHPMDHDSVLHPITIDAIHKVVHTCPTKLAKERLAAVFKVRKLSEELTQVECELKDTMHPDVRKCVKSKKIALFESLLAQLDYWDMEVVDLLKHGVPLIGLQAAPKGYQKHLVPASMTEDELLQSAKWRRKAIMAGARRMTKDEQSSLQETTAAEVERGFLQGPYTEDEMTVLFGSENWTLNPRFVLFQGANNKVRVIDDAKQGSVNAAYSSTVKLQLQDVDYAAAMVIQIMRELASLDDNMSGWYGKTFDLSKAYKQLAVLPEHQAHAVVGFPVDGVWRFYKSIALPFGCTGSVYGFVRVSQALWFLTSKLLHCIASALHHFALL